MIDHTVHWPALGYDESGESEGEKVREELQENRLFRNFVLGVTLASGFTYLVAVGVLAMATAEFSAQILGLTLTGPALLWAFMGGVAAVMIADEIAPYGTHSTIRFGFGTVFAYLFVWIVRGWQILQDHRETTDEPKAINEAADKTFLLKFGIQKGKRRLD